MKDILRDLVERKMTIRKLILWVFWVLFLVLVSSAGIAVVRAVWAVSDFTVENPEVWIR